MRLLIACDMEGITGVVDWKQVDSSHPEYEIYRQQMTEDVNAAIRGAFEAGANEVIISDGHGGKTNLVLKQIDRRAWVNCGTPSPLGMVEGLDLQVDGALLVGYHARSGAQNAVLAHTWDNTRVANLWINGPIVGEIGLNASVCGYYGTPVLMISGDQTACAEAAEFIPGIDTAVVKYATAYSAARCMPPAASCELIEQAAKRAVARLRDGQAPKPVQTDTPVHLKLEFILAGQADKACLDTRFKRLDGRTVEIIAGNMLEAYLAFRVAVMIAA
jgi:D-amino peptidase